MRINVRIPYKWNALKILEHIVPGKSENALFFFLNSAFINWVSLYDLSMSWVLGPWIFKLNSFPPRLIYKDQDSVGVVLDKSADLRLNTWFIQRDLLMRRYIFDSES